MTPMDIFDSMLESIQQFPLECNGFERRIKRLNKDHFKYSKQLDRMIVKLLPLENKRMLKTKKRLKHIIKKKLKLVDKFQHVIEKQQQKLTELVQISNLDPSKFNFSPLTGNVPAVIKLDNTPLGTMKYCVCGDKAFGNMICCDNPTCAIKWYHFNCVNLTSVPKTAWKCAKCIIPK